MVVNSFPWDYNQAQYQQKHQPRAESRYRYPSPTRFRYGSPPRGPPSRSRPRVPRTIFIRFADQPAVTAILRSAGDLATVADAHLNGAADDKALRYAVMEFKAVVMAHSTET